MGRRDIMPKWTSVCKATEVCFGPCAVLYRPNNTVTLGESLGFINCYAVNNEDYLQELPTRINYKDYLQGLRITYNCFLLCCCLLQPVSIEWTKRIAAVYYNLF